MKVTRFEDLECWQAARELVKRAYEVSQEGALSRDWDARSQFRRASVSVMNNIAEGLHNGREHVQFSPAMVALFGSLPVSLAT